MKLINFILKPPTFVIRSFVSTIFLISCVFFSKTVTAGEKCQIEGNGHLSLYSYQVDEALDITYKIKGKYNDEALQKIYNLLRSPDQKIYKIDIHLLEVIDHIQDHFGARTVEVISGYRSPAYNRRLKKEGKRVAAESLHLQGRALDIHLDEITEGVLNQYVRELGCGGVGFYSEHDFVHVDTGRVKYWGNETNKRKLVGTEDSSLFVYIITDKNDYFKSDVVTLASDNGKFGQIATVEFFEKGEWKRTKEVRIHFHCKDKCRATIPVTELQSREFKFGRLRLKFGKEILTNEFYIKRI